MSVGATPLKSGDLTYAGPRQLYVPKPFILATNQGGGEHSPLATTILMRVPSSQCRVKLSVVFFPTSGPLGDVSGVGSIWVSAAEKEIDGIAGSSGRIIPVTDVEGHSATPTTFPAAAGLGGYSREFVTSADYLQAVVNLQSIAGVAGAWVVQSSIQPDAVAFPWDAWDQIRRLFEVANMGPTGSL